MRRVRVVYYFNFKWIMLIILILTTFLNMLSCLSSDIKSTSELSDCIFSILFYGSTCTEEIIILSENNTKTI